MVPPLAISQQLWHSARLPQKENVLDKAMGATRPGVIECNGSRRRENDGRIWSVARDNYRLGK